MATGRWGYSAASQYLADIKEEATLAPWKMHINELIASDPDILSGQTVFAGTRVPVETLFDHLEAGIPLDEFLDDFPTVSKEQAVALLEVASKLLTDKNIRKVYAAAA